MGETVGDRKVTEDWTDHEYHITFNARPPVRPGPTLRTLDPPGMPYGVAAVMVGTYQVHFTVLGSRLCGRTSWNPPPPASRGGGI